MEASSVGTTATSTRCRTRNRRITNMMTTEELEKRLEYLDSKMTQYSHRPEIQFALIGAMAQTQMALVMTLDRQAQRKYSVGSCEGKKAPVHPAQVLSDSCDCFAVGIENCPVHSKR